MPSLSSTSVAYGILRQRHEEYEPELLEKLDDLYAGGFQIQRKAEKYLVRLEGESPLRYRERCELASYAAHFAQIVDQFTSDVFSQPLSVKPAADADNPNTPGDSPDEEFYSEFEKNADRKGTSFVDVMTETLRTALKHRDALVMVDAPDARTSPEPENLAEEESSGARRLYAYTCSLGRLINWKIDEETGKYVWAVLFDREQDQATPFVVKNNIRECFTIWTLSEAGLAQWQRFAIEYDPKEPPQNETFVELEDSGQTSFTRIPILRFCLSEGLWVGNKIGPQAMEHWQRRSALLGAENRSLVAIPYVKYGPRAPAAHGPIPSQQAEDVTRGRAPTAKFNSKGYLELDSGDEVGFAEPEGKCYELVDQQLEKLRESMFQVTFQMAASIQRNTQAVGRSGLSKKKDEDITSRVLRALGRLIRDFAVDVFDTISKARGEDVHWAPHGLDAYDSEDRQALIEEAIALDTVAEAIPSETFHRAHARAIAEKLLKGAVDVETLSTIIDELDKGISAKHEMFELEREAHKDELLNPPEPEVVVAKGKAKPTSAAA